MAEMNEAHVLIEQHRYNRMRLLKTLEEIEGSGMAKEAIHWSMPFGKGRAHIGWQMMHCAATLDRYLNVRILAGQARNAELVENYAGGSESKTDLIVTPQQIRASLDETTAPYFDYFLKLDPAKLREKPHAAADRTNLEILMLLSWHEAHHQGQCHIIWNSFKAVQ